MLLRYIDGRHAMNGLYRHVMCGPDRYGDCCLIGIKGHFVRHAFHFHQMNHHMVPIQHPQ
jgi:hypothetical protein